MAFKTIDNPIHINACIRNPNCLKGKTIILFYLRLTIKLKYIDLNFLK